MWKLGRLSPKDIIDIATIWLESDLGDVNVACLASYGTAYMHEIQDEIVAAFEEIGVRDNLNKNEQVFISLRHYLRLISREDINPYYACKEIVALETEFHPEIKLFDRPDCDKVFAERAKVYKYPGKQFAGQFFGIEKLYELNYRKDDYDVWTAALDEEARQEITEEAIRLLKTLFSKNSKYSAAIKE